LGSTEVLREYTPTVPNTSKVKPFGGDLIISYLRDMINSGDMRERVPVERCEE
jgi:hypothetical protein